MRPGLGLKARQEAVRSYLNGGDWNLVAEVVEVESGKRNDRPKLDRLACNVAFISNLMKSGVEFTVVDFP